MNVSELRVTHPLLIFDQLLVSPDSSFYSTGIPRRSIASLVRATTSQATRAVTSALKNAVSFAYPSIETHKQLCTYQSAPRSPLASRSQKLSRAVDGGRKAVECKAKAMTASNLLIYFRSDTSKVSLQERSTAGARPSTARRNTVTGSNPLNCFRLNAPKVFSQERSTAGARPSTARRKR